MSLGKASMKRPAAAPKKTLPKKKVKAAGSVESQGAKPEAEIAAPAAPKAKCKAKAKGVKPKAKGKAKGVKKRPGKKDAAAADDADAGQGRILFCWSLEKAHWLFWAWGWLFFDLNWNDVLKEKTKKKQSKSLRLITTKPPTFGG